MPRTEQARQSSSSKHSHLDELICHLRRDIDALHVVFTSLTVLALCRQCVCTRQVLLAALLASVFRSLLGGKRPAVKDEVGSDAVVAK